MNPIRNHPDIRAVAEERARIRFETFYRLNQPEPAALWVDLSPSYREEHIAVEFDLLTDLTRPDSFDALVRVLAKRVGLVCGATAPQWYRRQSGDWVLESTRSLDDCTVRTERRVFGDSIYNIGEPRRTYMRGLDTIADPAAALLACLEATEPA